MRVFLNGFGRIGRTVLRQLVTTPAGEGVELVGINDLAPAQTCAYLFEFDSVFGPLGQSVTLDDGHLVVAGRRIPLTATADLGTLDLQGVDVVLECTGCADVPEVARRGLARGAGRILISGPSAAADLTLVRGANDADFTGQRVVSNASCTTNALAPLMSELDRAFGLISGQMTTIHCYTGSQPTVDAARGDLVRSRAAALSMVPTTTSAGQLIDTVLPHLAGRVEARAVRVPTASVSAIDLTVQTRETVDPDRVNGVLRAAAAPPDAVLGWTDRPLVSTDLRARPESLVVDLAETSVSRGGLLRVFGWYDNEWGFTVRLLEVARRMAAAG